MKIFLYAIIIYLTSPFCVLAENNDPIVLQKYDHFRKIEQKCTKNNCLNMDQIITHGIEYGYDTNLEAERLYRARQQIGLRLGSLFPHFNLNNVIMISEKNFFQAAISFLGFIYPSNWFKWSATKRQAKAKEESFKMFLANRINQLEILYLNIHLLTRQQDILKHYKKQIIQVINKVIYQNKVLNRTIDAEQLGLLYLVKNRIQTQIATTSQNIGLSLSELAYAISYARDWQELSLQRFTLIIIKPKKYDLNKLILNSHQVSPELKTISYLKKATSIQYKSLYFDFLHPESSLSLGLKTIHTVKISRSKIRELDLQWHQTMDNIKLAMLTSTLNYNHSNYIFKKVSAGKFSLEGPTQALIDNLFNINEVFDIEKPLRYFAFSREIDLQLNALLHLNLIAQSNIKRLLLKGKHYSNIPKISKKNKKGS